MAESDDINERWRQDYNSEARLRLVAPLCCLCGEPCEPWHEPPTGDGHNPHPLGKEGDRCCDYCNASKVITARLAAFVNRPDEGGA